MSLVSIIIPVYNEAENIQKLLTRVGKVAWADKRKYEVIIIDDRSTDQTGSIISSLETDFPVRYYIKKGKKGKAFSLLEGFSRANGNIIVMIDADLQYPPEAIPAMVDRLESAADIVVSRRTRKNVNILRNVSSHLFTFLFVKLLHKVGYDSQSGLKAFKKSVLERIHVQPRSPWMFDLEFILQARNAGYVIDEISIPFSNRQYGHSKINIVKSSTGMAFEAIRLKQGDSGIVPFSKKMIEKKGRGFHYRGKEYVPHSRLALQKSAFKRFTRLQNIIMFFIAGFIIASAVRNIHLFFVVMVAVITCFYFLDLLFQLYLTYISVALDPSIKVTDRQLSKLNDSELPVYTVLCPLYKEWEVLPQFIASIDALEYPKNKLQVLILLEEDDKQSIMEIAKMSLPKNFEILVVPHSLPKTKPKALNYGLQFTKGEYLVIYDAEDKPESQQLKKAYFAFAKAKNNVACIQAKLNYYNPQQNILTRLFSLEYSLWFDLILPGLQALQSPIPLGGTSNHFKTELITKLNGWDSFNVTEDADLGIRLFKNGYRTEIIDSVTYEEATSEIFNWIKQRTRWIKGYIQTYFVHLRINKNETQIIHSNILIYTLLLGSKSFFLLINPVF